MFPIQSDTNYSCSWQCKRLLPENINSLRQILIWISCNISVPSLINQLNKITDTCSQRGNPDFTFPGKQYWALPTQWSTLWLRLCWWPLPDRPSPLPRAFPTWMPGPWTLLLHHQLPLFPTASWCQGTPGTSLWFSFYTIHLISRVFKFLSV